MGESRKDVSVEIDQNEEHEGEHSQSILVL